MPGVSVAVARWGEEHSVAGSSVLSGARADVGSRTSGARDLATLETFGVPFATYDGLGRRTHASPTAEALLAADPGRDAVWCQAARLVADALTDVRGSRYSCDTERRVVAGSGSYTLAVRVLQRRAPMVAAVVVLLPALPGPGGEAPDLAHLGLTPREGDVARLIAAGKSTKEVAAALAISCHTARHHTERVFTKLGVRGRVAVALLLGGRVGASSHTGAVGGG